MAAAPVVVGAAALAMSAAPAGATLNIDLRAIAVNGQPLSGGNSSHLIVLQSPGDVISFDIYATVTGANASLADDKFIGVSGSLRSAGSLKGNLLGNIVRSVTDPNTGEILTPGFDGAGFSVGLQQDLDGDGDLDVGSNVNSDSAGFWSAQYILGQAGAVAGSNNPTVGGRRIGFGTFTATSSVLFQTTLLNFRGRNNAFAAQYIQDGQLIQEESLDGLIPITVRGPFDPEPASLTWIVAGLGLLRRRSR
jgi:hypothetical protein